MTLKTIIPVKYLFRLLPVMIMSLWSCNFLTNKGAAAEDGDLPLTAVKANWFPVKDFKWKEISPSITNSGKHISIHLNKLPKTHFSIDKYYALKQSPAASKLSLNNIPSIRLGLETLPTLPLHFKMCLLGKPVKSKTGMPQMKYGASEPILIFNKDQGVINGSVVNCMLQDRLGRLWIGTNEGVSVYDGECSMSYQTLQGLKDNRIWSITEDEDGLIWLGTYFGLEVINPKNNTISHVNSEDWLKGNYCFGILHDSRGYIWVATVRGLYVLDKTKNKIYKFTETEGLQSDIVRTVFEDRLHRIWAGTQKGATLIDVEHKLVYGVSEQQGLPAIQVMAIGEDDNGGVYFGNKKGVYCFDSRSDRIIHIDSLIGFPDNDIRSIVKDKEGLMYIGTRNKGLVIFDPVKQQLKNISVNEGLNTEYVSLLFFDKQQQLWIGGFSGLNILNTTIGKMLKLDKSSGLHDRNFNTFLEDKKGNIWMGGSSGIDIYHPQEGVVTFVPPSAFLSESGCSNLFEDSKGNIYIGSINAGLNIFNPQTGYLQNFGQEQEIGNYTITKTIEDAQGKIWILTIDGINKYDPVNHTLKLNNELMGIYENVFTCAVNGNQDDIWIGGLGGVYRYFLKTDKLVQLDIMAAMNTKRVNTMFMDSHHQLWIGTNEDGIYIYQTETDSVLHITSKDELPDMTIRSFMEQDGKMYVTTNKSLTVIEESGGLIERICNYTKAQGLSSVDFIANASMRTRNGELWWGQTDGITIIKPKPITPVLNITHITSLEINGEPFTFETDEWTLQQLNQHDTLWSTHNDTFFVRKAAEQDINHSGIVWDKLLAPYYLPKHLTLPYKKNQLTFNFNGIYINEQDHARYKFKLDGLDEKWSPLTKQNHVEFRNLAPGDYTFKVTSCGLSGMCGIPSELHFTILAPWWQTLWFYLCCLVGAVMLVFFYNRYRVNLFRQQTQQLEKIVAERTLQYKQLKERAERSEKMEQQFLANMSHEIRTPMNAVMGMTNILIEKNPSETQLSYLQNIKRSSENLLVILNDILDISKIEAGKIELEWVDMSIQEVMHMVKQIMQYKAEEKGLLLKFEIDKTIPPVVVGDAIRLNQILVNLVGNAIKFTDKGNVTIKAVRNTKTKRANQCAVLFTISDTGIGMNDEQQQKIFESFTQASSDTTRKYGGTGLGLSISKQLVELYGSHISVTSTPNIGSSFFFEIKFKVSPNRSIIKTNSDLSNDMIVSMNGLHILLAEDNEYNRIVAIDTLNLKLKNLVIDIATNGKEAIEKVQEVSYDLILMDIQMPVMDGLEATRIIRSQHKDVPILALTASVVKSDTNRFFAEGMNGFIPKPFRVNELLLAIYQAIHKVDITQNILPEKELASNGALIDLDFLYEFTERDEAKMAKYINMYLKSIPVNLNKIHASLIAEDRDNIRIVVHSFKPHLQFMGMAGTRLLADKIEHGCEEQMDIIQLTELINRLTDQCRKSITELENIKLRV